MRRALNWVSRVLGTLFALFALVWIANASWWSSYTGEGLERDTCTADRIFPPEHGYIENTLDSMAAAFNLGADVIEFDIHPTTDGQFAVFHDWTLDCRTNGKGVTREHTMAYLKTLDIGHGYTADGGKTFPFRGQFVGAMPTLDEVLARFPDKRFLINIKSRDPHEGRMLAARLKQLPDAQQALLMSYGGDESEDALAREVPHMRTMADVSPVSCWKSVGTSTDCA